MGGRPRTCAPSRLWDRDMNLVQAARNRASFRSMNRNEQPGQSLCRTAALLRSLLLLAA